MEDAYGIAAFRSRQQVFRFETYLKKENLANIRVISTPREVATGCGLSVRFDIADTPTVKAVVRRTQPTHLIGLYHVNPTPGGRAKLTVISRDMY